MLVVDILFHSDPFSLKELVNQIHEGFSHEEKKFGVCLDELPWKVKTEPQKYRYFIKMDHNLEYRVFESRYYAEKWLYEVYLNEKLDNDSFQIYRRNGFQYEVKKADEGFIIYKIWKEVL